MIDPNDTRTQNEKDLTMLVQQMVRRVRKDSPNDELCDRALNFLVRKNLIRATDILR